MVISRANSLAKPIKWFNIGEHFRYERPQKGRGRSFFQFNADLLGESGPTADAELIAMLVMIFETLGLSQSDFKIRLSDRVTWISLLRGLNVSTESLPMVLDAIDKSERRNPEQTIEALEKSMPGEGEDLFDEINEIKQISDLKELTDRLERLGDEEKSRGQEWIELMEMIHAHGVADAVTLDLSIVRGLAYYTGFVFEAFEASGEGRALAGGGTI